MSPPYHTDGIPKCVFLKMASAKNINISADTLQNLRIVNERYTIYFNREHTFFGGIIYS